MNIQESTVSENQSLPLGGISIAPANLVVALVKQRRARSENNLREEQGSKPASVLSLPADTTRP